MSTTSHDDLSTAFAAPNRAAGLRPLPARDTTKSPAAAPAEQAQTVRPPAASQPATTRRAPRRTSTGDRLLIALPLSLRDRLRAVAQTRQVTYRDLVLDAIEATVDELPSLLTPQASETVHTGLFERAATRKTKPATEGTAQVTIRGLTPQNRDVLAQLVTDTGATSLTQLITTALDKHLPERPRALR